MKRKTIYTIVAVVSLYIVAQAIADVGATKMIQIGDIALPAGTLMFAITFTLRDMIHKRLGKEWAKAVIYMAAILNILQAGYLFAMTKIPAPPFYQFNEAWSAIFAIVPAITIASIIAEVVSQLIDTEVYQLYWNNFPRAPQWTRVLISNFVALPVDSLLFALLAFTLLPPLFGGEAISLKLAISLTAGQIIFKGLVTIVSMPLIYLVGSKPYDLSDLGQLER